MASMKLLIVGTDNEFCLETSYATAAAKAGLNVVRFDPNKEIIKYIRLGKFGKYVYDFLHVDAWARKMNRDLIIRTKREKPEVLILVGASKIYYGTLATIKVILPKVKVLWIWPDTPMNLNSEILNCAKLIDVSATYSKTSIPVFNSLGFPNVHWIPLAGDTSMHGYELNKADDFRCDVSFVGMWRPEREHYLKIINNNFGNLNIEIHGSYWQRNCVERDLLKKWKGYGFYAGSLADYFNHCRININIIDETNYPAANMRFFEIPTSGGLQLSSACPEFEDVFIDKTDILYFHDETELIEKMNWILSNRATVSKIRQSAQQKIREAHSYDRRLQDLLGMVGV